ncbi:MAG: energy transducer TonB [Vicinamibacterales bacterium]
MRAVVSASLVVACAAAPAAAQSLGHVAAEEAARRKAIVAPARVITDADLQQGPSQTLDVDLPAVEDPAVSPFVTRTPARFRAGRLPEIPIQAVAGGDVAVEATVAIDGRVSAVTALRHSSPFTEAVTAALGTWRFEAATDTSAETGGEGEPRVVRTPVESRVLVLGLFRPPALFPGTLGTPPADVARASATVPYPTAPPRLPQFPPNALFDGVVLVELAVLPDGSVGRSRVLQSAPGFDQPALEAARAIGFRPARVHGRPSPALVYVVAAFRQPITP